MQAPRIRTSRPEAGNFEELKEDLDLYTSANIHPLIPTSFHGSVLGLVSPSSWEPVSLKLTREYATSRPSIRDLTPQPSIRCPSSQPSIGDPPSQPNIRDLPSQPSIKYFPSQPSINDPSSGSASNISFPASIKDPPHNPASPYLPNSTSDSTPSSRHIDNLLKQPAGTGQPLLLASTNTERVNSSSQRTRRSS